MVEVDWRQYPQRPMPRIHHLEPDKFQPERTTVWSFPDRGRWASHTSGYPGNWAPEVPRNLILRYTDRDETVLDPMMGGGTTLIECMLTHRNGIGVEIETAVCELAARNLNLGYWPVDWARDWNPIRLYVGDARRLDLLRDGCAHLVLLHPPYGDIIHYGNHTSKYNLSRLPLEGFLTAMSAVAREAFRVLAPGRHCAVLIGDTRRHKHYVPLSARLLEQFLEVGFILREEIFKLQHKMRTTREKWRGRAHDFYLIAHEDLFVFRKPEEGEDLDDYRYSVRWR